MFNFNKKKNENKNKKEGNDIFNLSHENSFLNLSKNYILKSDFLTTESQNNISKEENFYSNSNRYN